MAHVGEGALVGQDLVLLAAVHSVAALEHLSGDEALLFFGSRLSFDAALTTLDVTGIVRVLASELIEVLMLDGLSSTDALVRVHLHHLAHEVDFDIVHAGSVSSLQRLRLSYFGKLQASIARVSRKFVLQKVRQRSEDLLNHE